MCKKKKRYGNPMREKAYREALKSQGKSRLNLGKLRGDFKSACNHVLKSYPYAICCGAGDYVKIHGCFEAELQDEYHWVVEQVYEQKYGFPVMLTNSSHPSNKVCPQDEIMKTLKRFKSEKSNFAYFEGGQYDFMFIAYAPFPCDMESAA